MRSTGSVGDDTPVFVISVAAQLAGMHAQTLRTYDRMGLVSPGRAPGGGRRYSARDVALLREVQRLSQEEGINLAGVRRIIELEGHVEALQKQLAEVTAELEETRRELSAAYAAAEQAAASVHASYRRDLIRVPRPNEAALVVWQPERPRRR